MMIYAICCQQIMNMQDSARTTSAQSSTLLSQFLNVKRTCPTHYPWLFLSSSSSISFPQKEQSFVKSNFRFCKLFREQNRRGVWSAYSCDRLAFLTLLGQVKSLRQFLCMVSPNTTSTVSPRFLLASFKPSTHVCVSSTPLSRTSPLQIAQQTTSISFLLQRTPTRPRQDLYFISW